MLPFLGESLASGWHGQRDVRGLRVGMSPRPLEPDPDHAGEGKEDYS